MKKINNPEDFRKILVDMVKASGQEIIDRADDLVGNGDLISDFHIRLNFPLDGGMLYGVPTIELTREYLSKNCYSMLMDGDDD